MKNGQHNQIRTLLHLIQVQAVLYAVISATAYYRFPGPTPYEIACGISTCPCYSQQLKYATIQEYAESIWQHAHGVSIP